MLESILFEQDNAFAQAKKINSVKLYTGEINPTLIAKGFDEESGDPEAVLDLMQDGAFIGKILEKTVLNRLKKMNFDVQGLGKNAPYDLKYSLKLADDQMEQGNIEVRVIGKTGVDLSPSSTRGAQRKRDAVKTQQKIEGSKYYILVDIRKIKSEIMPSTYDVYLVLSDYLANLFKGGKLGKYGGTKNAQAIDLLLKGKLSPNSIEEFEELIVLLQDELKNPQTIYPRRAVLKLINQYQKELIKLKDIKSSLDVASQEPSPSVDAPQNPPDNLRLVAEYRYRQGALVLTMAE
jgi:hypothetical protein